MKLSIDFAKAVVEVWKTHGFTWRALYIANGYDPEERKMFSEEEWYAFKEQAGVPKYQSMTGSASTFVAKHFVKANQALWDGKYELAWKWMASGKDLTPAPRVAPNTEARRAFKKQNKEIIFVKARELNKQHDWKTCK